MRLSFVLIVLIGQVVFAQNTDSLKLALKQVKQDTVRIKLIKEIGEIESIFRIGYWDTLRIECEKLIVTCPPSEKLFYQKQLAYALNNIGYVADEKGDMQKALEYYNKSLKIQEAINDKEGLARSLNNIGSIYENFGDIIKTLEYYNKSLKVREDIRDEKGVAVCLNNIGLVYFKQKFYSNSSTSYFTALKILEKIKNVDFTAIVLSNIGLVYKEQQNYESALNYFQRAKLLQESIHDDFNLFATLNNIGTIYEKQKNYPLALEYFNKNLALSETLKYKKGIAVSLYNISDVSFKTANLAEAQAKGQLSLHLFQELGFPDHISNVSHLLSEIYEKKGNYRDAYLMQILYKKMADSTNNDVNRKALIQRDLQYTFEKKVIADSLKVDEERKVFSVKIQNEKNQRYYLYGGLALLLLFSGFMFNRFKVTQKQNLIINNQKLEVELKNEEITYQKELVDVKQKEIIDSINYAKRIQQAVLTGEDVWSKISQEHFILFKPKDIVSGDFYWAYNTPNGRSIFALADCTGHGVPGGFMSMLGNSFLNEIVVENKIFKANEILNRLRAKVIAALEQKGQTEQKDGMDISLCVWNKMDNTLEFAAANNPLWLLRKTVSSSVSSRAESRDENREIIEYKADKMPIGTYLEIEKPFTSTTIQLQQGDILYLSTDGYADQFGGPKGKKFKYKALLDMLMTNSTLEMGVQKTKLDDAFVAWKNKQEQVDDVAVIGVRVMS